MQDDPYASIVAIMQKTVKEGIPDLICIGKVLSENPVKIEVGTIEFEQEELMCARGYLPRNGASVLLIPINDKQRMIILCEVVDL